MQENELLQESQQDDVNPMGTTSLAEITEGISAPATEEIEAIKEKSNSSVYIGVVGAVTKLQEELKNAKDKAFANPVIEHLIERCKESESLASDVCQNHKSWEKCFKYIYERARKRAKGNTAAVRDDVVYEWAEDYYHLDDKAEEEKKAKEEAKRKLRQAEEAAERKKRAEEKKHKEKAEPKKNDSDSKTESKPKEKPVKTKHEPKKKENDGQMTLFDFI